jgi:hypothetical protein
LNPLLLWFLYRLLHLLHQFVQWVPCIQWHLLRLFFRLRLYDPFGLWHPLVQKDLFFPLHLFDLFDLWHPLHL